ncbi:AAA family ATPase [Pseudacidovorax sp. RU35E]|uniref:AAA family ATPase n=1 Tax=Pseudacidovorax sp. RU35E TaxID=1907403 RepID=UPI0009569BC6|nr:AAA family ATPase [Pseudacidovorax sp. RU35E]SIQ57047.1 AAA ATPase domain-containing protein [Pseudacidovorax sp. RU35E]
MTLFHRTALADQMARQLLRPGLLDQGLRSGLFLSGLRRTGKTTFLRQDLIPALEALGAIVIYVDLWTDTRANPATLIHAAIQRALAELQTPASGVLARLKRLKGLDVGAAGFKFGFQLNEVGAKGGVTLADALTEVVDKARTDVVLIVDEVQQALAGEDGAQMLLAIKAARDAINPRPATPGHFIFIGTGSHRAQVVGMTLQGRHAFAGATSVDYPTLDGDYVAHVLDAIALEGARVQPSLAVAIEAFDTLGRRPEELIRALRQLQQADPAEADRFLPVIAATLRTAAADVELRKVEDLGTLAGAVFDRVAQAEGDATGLFGAQALADYTAQLGRDVTADQVQRVADELRDANLIIRKGHGVYAVTDPFVQAAWRERKALAVGTGQSDDAAAAPAQ